VNRSCAATWKRRTAVSAWKSRRGIECSSYADRRIGPIDPLPIGRLIAPVAAHDSATGDRQHHRWYKSVYPYLSQIALNH
jgi:hypothetical protein